MTRQEAANAFIAGKQGKTHNSKTDGTTYWLHGHPIAHKVGGSVIVSWCGWHTRTTAAHINAIAQAYGSDKRFSYAQARDKGEDNAML
jgi:hypothetical protein